MKSPNSPSSQPSGESGASSLTQMGDALSDTKNSLAQTARDTAAKVKTAVTDTASRAKEEAGRVAMEKKEMAANRIGTYSSAIHDSAKSLEQKDPNIAWLTHQTADKINQVADYLRTRDLPGLRQDAENMARRHPGVFFGGLFLAGLVLGNVVKASRRKVEGSSPENGNGNGNGDGTQSYGQGTYLDQNAAQRTEGNEAPRSSGGI